MLASLALLVLLQAPQRAGADACASAKPAAAMRAVVVVPPSQARDTLVRATVCVVPASGGAASSIGSYHGELHFDSTAASVVRVEKPAGGVRVENSNLKGQVNFAGAAPAGFPGRSLVTVVLRVRRPGSAPTLKLTMKELNSTDGKSLMKQLVVAGANP